MAKKIYRAPDSISHSGPPTATPPGTVISDLSVYHRIPVYFIDYLWVILIYFSIAFWLAVLIDSVILPPFDEEKAKETSTWVLYFQVLVQFAVQGFIVIVLNAFIQLAPSPVTGLLGYNPHGNLGTVIIRNPAIMTVVLFFLSQGLQGRLKILFSRFDKHAVTIQEPKQAKSSSGSSA